jgi:glycosyltransferase involved in cell wall biosynthesis
MVGYENLYYNIKKIKYSNSNKVKIRFKYNQKMISVILTAYNRKEYLKNALDSLKRQTIKNFEIILITNFDFPLYNFGELNIKHIVMDGNIGKFLYEGVKNSSGDVLVLMDDDDTFSENKLKYVDNTFKDKKIGYLHNFSILNNSKKRLFLPPDFNSSSISIRKDIILPYIDHLNRLEAGPDSFLYLCALCSGYKILNRRVYLTYYNVHSGNTSNINFNKAWLLKDLDALKYMQSIFSCKKSRNYLDKLILGINIKLYIFYNEKISPRKNGTFLISLELWLYFLYAYGILDKKLKLILKKFIMQIW